MTSDVQWYPLAELYLKSNDFLEDIYCLCTRCFIRSRDDKGKHPDNTGEEFDNCLIEAKTDKDGEVLSCYCSASHTDNISTDEHDSLRDSHSQRSQLQKGLQSSDSGADLTEHNIKIDADAAWHKFWANHGERLIWDSWITKYSDYINPEYLVNITSDEKDDVKEELQQQQQLAKSSKFSFDKKDIDQSLTIIDENKVLIDNYDGKQDAAALRNRYLVRNLSGSDSFDKLNADISEGWNPLSPLSVDCETEAERLLSSRCGSHASGSIRTVDSMTNVTRMTVSSIDLSENSKNSESFSSISSVQSSLSSSSSVEFEDSCDYETQWNVLWKQHYEDEYLKHYNKFVLGDAIKFSDDNDVVDDALKEEQQKQILHSAKRFIRERKGSNANSSVDESELRKPIDLLNISLNSMKMDENTETQSNDFDLDGSSLSVLGLPTSFGRKSLHQKAKKTSTNEENITDRIKSSFNLMGIELNEGSEGKLKGHVEYKMKHIRLQNRLLKLHHSQNNRRPKHTHFDDDGNEIVVAESNDEAVAAELSDETKQTSSSNEDLDNKMIEVAPQMDANKKRRKRKLNLPSEIKENPKLRKYWEKRFSLFNRFDQGIKLDEESWYSVSPEQVAKHTAERCKCDIIIDAFCGAGGNAIQFAFTCNKVIAIDIDRKKIELAKNNAQVYGVADKIDFIIGDFLQLAHTLKGDVVFLSPPWGGPKYGTLASYDLETMLEPVPASKLISTARQITNNLVLFLPKNSNTFPLIYAAGPGGQVEIEQNFINKKLIAITAYYDSVMKQKQ